MNEKCYSLREYEGKFEINPKFTNYEHNRTKT